MAIFEVNDDNQLSGFRPILGGPDQLYESEIEELVWLNSEELTGEGLFPIARQPTVGGGGKPDIVALDRQARVVVIEVKRDIDRGQLAQCLEYAGWARSTNLDELSSIYHAGEEQFFRDWGEFTDGESLRPVNPDPQLVLVARDFAGRTKEALDFLISNGLPVALVSVSVHEDPGGRRFLEVSGVQEPSEVSEDGSPAEAPQQKFERISISDLIEAGFVEAGDKLVWERPRRGETHEAMITSDAEIKIADGRTFSSPSGAARAAADIPAYNGWNAWTVERTGKSFSELWYEVRLAKHAAQYGTDGPKYQSMLADYRARHGTSAEGGPDS